ncbi:MAG: hypothetical protein EON54_20545 [Alcaligenaceae bacterium]|nr:MAG: hypothetical protein EON54_20545 [Alcaligenaceae bacterium]
MKNDEIVYWSVEDFRAGICDEDAIGTVKPPAVEARRLAQSATVKAIKAIMEVMEQTDDPVAKLKAAQLILDRGWGKPDQTVHQDSTNTTVIEMPWITAQRLAYRLEQRVADDIVDQPVNATEQDRLRIDKKGS